MGGGQFHIWLEPGYVFVWNSRGQNLTAHCCVESWPVFCIPRFTGPYDEYSAASLSRSHFLDPGLFPDSQHADTPPDTQPIDTLPDIQLHGDSQTIADTPYECYTIESSTLVDSQLDSPGRSRSPHRRGGPDSE